MKKTIYSICVGIIFLMIYSSVCFAGPRADFGIRDGRAIFRIHDMEADAESYMLILFAKSEYQNGDVWVCVSWRTYSAELLASSYIDKKNEITNIPSVKKAALKLFEKQSGSWNECIDLCESSMGNQDASFNVTVKETGELSAHRQEQKGKNLYVLIEDDNTVLPLELAEELYGFETESDGAELTITRRADILSENTVFFDAEEEQNGLTLEEAKIEIAESTPTPQPTTVIPPKKEKRKGTQDTAESTAALPTPDEKETPAPSSAEPSPKPQPSVTVPTPGEKKKLTPSVTEPSPEPRPSVTVPASDEKEALTHSVTEPSPRPQPSVTVPASDEKETSASSMAEPSPKPQPSVTVPAPDEKETVAPSVAEPSPKPQPSVTVPAPDEKETLAPSVAEPSPKPQPSVTVPASDEKETLTPPVKESQDKIKPETSSKTGGMILLSVLFSLLLAAAGLVIYRRKKNQPVIRVCAGSEDEDTIIQEDPVSSVKKKPSLQKLSIESSVVNSKGLLRKNNEDNFYLNGTYMQRDKMDNGAFLSTVSQEAVQLYAVCDGMGGADSGEEASHRAVQKLALCRQEHGRMEDPQKITAVLRVISETIYQEAVQRSQKSGTTIVMALFKDGKAVLANVGDSRIYRLRNQHLTQMSLDHSKVQRLISMGLLTPEKAKKDPNRHVITQYLGMPADIKVSPYIVENVDLKKGDIFVLCSDGLTDMVEDSQIESILRQKKKARNAAQELVKAALAHGGRDNVTVMVLRVL